MKKFLIVAVVALATPAMADDCPDKVIAAADHLGLNRAESFDAAHPAYSLPASLDGGGLLVMDCYGATEVTMAVDSKKPNDRLMALFGAFANGVAGVSAQDAVASALECQKDGLARKVSRKGWFSVCLSKSRTYMSVVASATNSHRSVFFIRGNVGTSRIGLPSAWAEPFRETADIVLVAASAGR